MSGNAGGQWKPLGVWKEQGFGVEAMERDDPDSWVDTEQPWLGKQYKVKLFEETSLQRVERAQILLKELKERPKRVKDSRKSKRPRVEDNGAEASQLVEGRGVEPAEELPPKEEDASQKSADESEVEETEVEETDSDSSDSKQRRKKRKKEKKEKKKLKQKAKKAGGGRRQRKEETEIVKAKLAAERLALTEKKRLDAQALQEAKKVQSEKNQKVKQAKALSARASAAIKNPLDTISRLMIAPEFKGLSNDVRDPLMKAFNTLSKMDTEAKANSSREEAQQLSFDAKELKDRIAEASRASSAANGLIKAIACATKRLSVGGGSQV